MSFRKTSGKVGEFVVNQIEGQAVLKARAFHNGSQTTLQILQRGVFTQIAGGWQAQSRPSQSAWVRIGRQMTDPEGKRIRASLTGYQAFQSVQNGLYAIGSAFNFAAPQAIILPEPMPPVTLNATVSGTHDSVFALSLECVGYEGFVQVQAYSALLEDGTPDYSKNAKVLGTISGLSEDGTAITNLWTAAFDAPVFGDQIVLKLVPISAAGFRSAPVPVTALVRHVAAEASGDTDGAAGEQQKAA